MSSYLIIYSSTDGHTKIICERIRNFLNDGNLVKLISLQDVKKVDLSNYPRGIYVVQIKTQDSFVNKRLVLQ